MQRKLYTYETTYEREDSHENVIAAWEVKIKYTWTPGIPARIRYDENDHPAEGDEIEINDIQIETWQSGLGKNAVYTWTPVKDLDFYDTLNEWAGDKLRDNLIENASEEEGSAHEAAREQVYEARRDLERLDGDR